MVYNITALDMKRYVLIFFLGSCAGVFTLVVFSFAAGFDSEIAFAIMVLLGLAPGPILAHRFAKKPLTISLEQPDIILVNGEYIPCNEVRECFFNDSGITVMAMIMKFYDNTRYSIFTSNLGQVSIDFQVIREEMLAHIVQSNPDLMLRTRK
jgi:hypothetical protein